MPPKKRGGAAAAAAAVSPAAKKRLTTTSAKKRTTPAKKPLDAPDGASPTAAAFHGDKLAGGNAAATPPQVAVSPGQKEKHALSAGSAARGPDSAVAGEEGFHAAAAGTEGAVVTTTDRRGDAPGEEMGLDVGVFGGEVNGSLGGEEKPTPVVRNVEVREEMGVAAAAAGFPEEGEGAHLVAGSKEVEGAAEGAAARGNIASSNEEEEVMIAEDGPGARTSPSYSMAAAADIIDAADAHPMASGVTELPAPLLRVLQQQMGAPSRSILKGVDELRGLTTALSTFIRCWDRLSHHLDSIQASMDILSRSHGARCPLASPATGSKRPPEEMERDADERKKSAVMGEAEENVGGGEEAKKPEQPQKAPPLDLESICEKMLGRNLRRYVVAHMSDVDRLREEVPRALRLAPDPAKLVLSCIGRFYLQGSKAYVDPNSPMVSVRRACILVLEFFLLSGCPFSGSTRLLSASSDATTTHAAACTETAEGKMEAEEGKEESSSSVTEEAKVAAVAWKNRLVAEGGIALASAVDALGLALFVASFGIPLDFDSQMMYDVFHLCNMKKKADILRQSPIIVEKLPDVIQDLVQNENYIAAADLACGFGLQEKFPPLDLISSFLIKTNTDIREERREGQSSITSQKEAAARQLGAYRSVVKCLEDHKLDPSSLTSFKIEEKMSELEKDIANLERKLKEKNLKRKAGNVEQAYEVKGPAKRPASTLAKATSGGSIPPRPTQDHHGRALSLSRNLYSSSSSNRFPGLLDGSGAGNPAGNALAPPTGAAGSRLAATSSLFGGGGYSSVGNNGVLPSLAESGGVSYMWHHGGASSDSSFGGHGYVGMGAQSAQGSLLMGGGGPASSEGFLQPQPLALGTGSRVMGSSTSLYGFADNVVENELLYYGHSVRSNVLPDSASGGGYR